MEKSHENKNTFMFASYPAALDALVAKLRAREFDPNEYYIVLTPDRYTQSVEQALFSGGGALDLEVLTLSRLSRRVSSGQKKTLSREGGVMLTARAVDAVKSSLTYYKRAADYPDFAREVYDTMQQLCASGVGAVALGAPRTATKGKLNDLALIRAEYVKRKGEYVDSPDRLIELIAEIPESELIKNAHIYAIGYSLGYDTTRLNRNVFEALRLNARSFEYYEAAPPTGVRDGFELFGAPDRVAQYKNVAMRICEYIRNGGAPDDVSIICPEPRTLARILREYGIEFYHDESVPLYSTPIISAIEHIYKLRDDADNNRKIDSRELVALCKNPFSGCADGDAQALQNLALMHGRYIELGTVFGDACADRAAACARELINKFDGSFADGVRSVAEYANFEDVQKNVFAGSTDTVQPMLALADLLDRYGSGSFKLDAKSFFAAARAVEVKSVPRYKHRVTVTMPASLRLNRCKLLFVTDFNEGVLPVAMSDSGLLCDEEITEINAMCSPERIEPTVREQNRRERTELAAAVYNAGEVYCSYVTSSKPSAFVFELAKPDNIKKSLYTEELSVLKETDDPQVVARYACVTAAAREIAARKLTKHAPSVVEAVGKSEHTAAAFEPVIAGGGSSSVSVSELTDYFNCPYKRFLHDAVGLTDRRKSSLDAPDFGSIMHDFMCALVEAGKAKNSYDTSPQNVERLVDEAIAKKGLHLDELARARLLADACEFAELNDKIIHSGRYVPSRTEMHFEGKTLGTNGVEFKGIIDRLDVCGDYFRIIDYKTGQTEFKPSACNDGTDMQLPLYAYAVGAENVSGFFYVKLARRYENKRPMSGRLVADVDIAESYDTSLASGGPSEIMSVRFTTDKKTKKTRFNETYKTQLERADFDALIDKCVKIAGGGADEMFAGYIARTPIPKLCDSCPYFGICIDGKVFRGSEEDDGNDD